MQASYRERFEKLDREDGICITNKYKEELSRKFGHQQVIASLNKELIDELHYILVMYVKPLSPERRVSLRRLLLPHLESSESDTLRFFEHLLEYYEVL